MKRLFFALSLCCFGFAAAADATSIFVQTPEVFQRRLEDLEKLQKNSTNKNEALDSLLTDANTIAKMNDQCAAVSINDVMGDDCWNFYQVVLPEFEDRYMRVTGELRLGYMEMIRGLEDRKKQIDACADALYSFAESKDQFLTLDGGVYLEPLSKGFQANYNFTLKYEPKHQKNLFQIAEKWTDACHEIVVRQDGENFAPFFVERLAKLNEDLKENGSFAVYKMDTTAYPVLYLDISRPIRSAYYLEGKKLFHYRISEGPASESNMRIHFEDGNSYVDGVSIVRKHRRDAKFKGSCTFAEREEQMTGRWIWETQGNVAGVDFGPDADEPEPLSSSVEIPIPSALAAESTKSTPDISTNGMTAATVAKDKKSMSTAHKIAIVFGGASLASLGTGLWFNYKGSEFHSDYEDAVEARDYSKATSAYDDLQDSKSRRNIAYGAAAGALAVGLLLWILGD